MDKLRKRLSRVTPQQLRAFEAVARNLSVTRAAAELFVTQPTVSVQLRELKDAVGEPLFMQQGRKLALTPTGELLQQCTLDISDAWDRFESQVADMRGLVSGHLRVAAVTTAEYFVPDLLGPFSAAHPGVSIELAVENRDRVVQRLARSADDVAVMMMPPADMALEQRPFMDNPLVVVAARSHPLFSKTDEAQRAVPLKRLAAERWLMRERGSGTRIAAEKLFGQRGFAPKVAMSLGSNEAIKHAVGAGLGIAVLSRLALGNGNDAGAQFAELKVAGFPIRRQWFVVWRRDRPLTTAAQRFVAHLGGAAP